MDGVELSHCYRDTTMRQFTFYHYVNRGSGYSFYRPQKDERLTRPWGLPVVLNPGPLDWESSAPTTRPLFLNMKKNQRTYERQQTCCLEESRYLQFDCSGIRIHNHLVHEQILNHLLNYLLNHLLNSLAKWLNPIAVTTAYNFMI